MGEGMGVEGTLIPVIRDTIICGHALIEALCEHAFTAFMSVKVMSFDIETVKLDWVSCKDKMPQSR